jgi:hypothetical protein
VIVAEFGRHFSGRPLGVSRGVRRRGIHEVPTRLECVVDLRDYAIARDLRCPADRDWFLDAERTRGVARRLRRYRRLQALLVPSVAFLDDFTRWNLVVYLDRVDHTSCFGSTSLVGELRVREIGSGFLVR